MKHRFLMLLASALALPVAALAQTAPSQRLAWLQGCWAAAAEGRVIEEQWMAPRGKAMFGTSRTVHDNNVVGYEFMLVREQGDHLAFEVRPSGKPAVIYESDSLDDSGVTFKNAKNEFPQHIGYKRDGPNAVLAWIEGEYNGQPRRVDFRYRKVACAGH